MKWDFEVEVILKNTLPDREGKHCASMDTRLLLFYINLPISFHFISTRFYSAQCSVCLLLLFSIVGVLYFSLSRAVCLCCLCWRTNCLVLNVNCGCWQCVSLHLGLLPYFLAAVGSCVLSFPLSLSGGGDFIQFHVCLSHCCVTAAGVA